MAMNKFPIILFLLIMVNCVKNEDNPFYNVKGNFDLLFFATKNELTCKDAIRNKIFNIKLADTNFLFIELDSSVEAQMKLVRKNKRNITFQKGIYLKFDSDVVLLDIIPIIRTIGRQGAGERKQPVIVDSQTLFLDFAKYSIRGDDPNQKGIIEGRPIVTFWADSFNVNYGKLQFAGNLNENRPIKLLGQDSIYNSIFSKRRIKEWYKTAITIIPNSLTTIGKLSTFSKSNDPKNICFYRF
jgi:hypothetical protein